MLTTTIFDVEGLRKEKKKPKSSPLSDSPGESILGEKAFSITFRGVFKV